MEEFVLIAQDEIPIACRRHQLGQTPWATVIYGQGDVVKLESVGLGIAIAKLYRGICLG